MTAVTPFKSLEDLLGKDLVDSIPTVKSPFKEGDIESDVCIPYRDFEDLPHDVVKMVLPSGNVCLVFRYISINPRIEHLISTFHERVYKSETKYWVDCVDLMIKPLRYTAHYYEGVPEERIAFFKGLLSGAPLEEVGYTFLPGNYRKVFLLEGKQRSNL